MSAEHMGVASEVQSRLTSEWVNPRVANWVISRLPLLELGETHVAKPVLNLNTENGMSMESGIFDFIHFKNGPKFVISGGFEGHKGHIDAIDELHEIRALNLSNAPIVIMLEPDNYIRKKKGREPLLTLEERALLWSTTGKVDAVITLPEKDPNLTDSEHYFRLHQHIKPASWCANIDNPHRLEIITRNDEEAIDVIRILVHKPNTHSSFLYQTKDMTVEELIDELKEHSLVLVKETMSEGMRLHVPIDHFAGIIYEKLIEGLVT